MPKANFTTEGITMTHSALLRRSFGIPSGMSMISLNTWPQLERRFCSLLSSAANIEVDRNIAITKAQDFFMMLLPGQIDSSLVRRAGTFTAGRLLMCRRMHLYPGTAI